MNLILAIPFEFRVAGLFVVGLFLGSLVNLGVYRLAWNRRSISPWSACPPGVSPRRIADRMPIFGWLGLRREAGMHGPGFWIRPMVVELFCGAGLAGLYWWEIGGLGLFRWEADALGVLVPVAVPDAGVLHAQYACHVVLISLMLISSLIDIDEKIIPDTITVPGTLFGLLVATVFPWSMLPDHVRLLPGAVSAIPAPDFLRVTSPSPWPAWLGGFPNVWPLVIGLGCWWLWCVALMPRTWYSRHGWLRAFRLMVARLKREPSTRWLGLLGLVGSVGMAAVWFVSGAYWEGLLSALVGMAAGGGVIWAVRVVGTAVLKREAMGFGDVTLMAMIGAFLGWQACLMVFFLAPFAGLIWGLVNLLSGRGPEIPYGPFLCLAAVGAIVCWAALWAWAEGIFGLGLFVPLAMVVCMALMALMLGLWRLVIG